MSEKKASGAKPVLVQLGSLWTLTDYGGKKSPWSVEKKIRKIRKAGFDGFMGRVPPVTREMIEENGLVFSGIVDLGRASEVRPRLKRLKLAGARCVNVQMLDHDTPTHRAVSLARRVMEAADTLALDVSIEVHRDTCTETPEKAYALAEGFEKAEKRPLKMTWDFSHPAVVKSLGAPFWDRLAERPDLIQVANQFHMRPFNGHHAQIPAMGWDGKLTPEFRDWLEFAERVFACWLEAATPGREIFVCPEQGAPGYDLSVFPDRWDDIQVIRRQLGKVWKRQLRSWTMPKG
ncbi:MAG: hypothetical protein R3F07_18565 [Opitutaceae bacterium]